MSMYEMMTGGPHPLASLWLGMLGIDSGTIERARNVYILKDSEPPVVYVLTRSENNEVLTMHPRLIRQDRAMAGDTYWEFEFSIPDEYLDDVRALGDIAILPRFQEHFNVMMAQLKGTPEEIAENPEARVMIERAKPILHAIFDKIKSGGGVIEV